MDLEQSALMEFEKPLLLEFEQSILPWEERIDELRKSYTKHPDTALAEEINRVEGQKNKALEKLYGKLTPWEKVLVARHESRPKMKDYVQHLMETYVPLSGDRCFGEDTALIGGVARFRDSSLLVLGHEKGNDTLSRLEHNFGMPHPEGYRKAIRLMELAQRFRLPIVSFVDTPGAYAGTGAEERGQSQAIAACLEKSFEIDVPVISFIIGEGGSGGAIALATANHIVMLEHSIYSVISPEGCASILWKSTEKKQEAAMAQKLTAKDLLELGCIDHILSEPPGGAHRHHSQMMHAVGNYLEHYLHHHRHEGKEHRRQKFLLMGEAFLQPMKS